jgi:hypothetical protein
MGQGTRVAGRHGLARRGMIAAGSAALAAATAVLVAGCGGANPPASHGRVVARLPIPFQAAGPAGTTKVIPVRVRPGQRFSIWVEAVGYPAFWREVGPAPDRRIVRAAGEIPDGTCPPQETGCATSSFYTFVARSPGTTTVTWQYRQGDASHQSSARVAVDITVL